MAACWYGGARAVGQTLRDAAAERDVGPHALAHLGAVDIALATARTALDVAAAEIDADPEDRLGGAEQRTLRLRALVETVAADVMRRVGRALGPARWPATRRTPAGSPISPSTSASITPNVTWPGSVP